MGPRLLTAILVALTILSCQVVGIKSSGVAPDQASMNVRTEALQKLFMARKTFQLLERVFRPLEHAQSVQVNLTADASETQTTTNVFYLARSLMDHMGLGTLEWSENGAFELRLPAQENGKQSERLTIISSGVMVASQVAVRDVGFRLTQDTGARDFPIFHNAEENPELAPRWIMDLPKFEDFLNAWLAQKSLAIGAGKLKIEITADPSVITLRNDGPFMAKISDRATVSLDALDVASSLVNDSILHANISGTTENSSFNPAKGYSFTIKKGENGLIVDLRPIGIPETIEVKP